ncbi:MAG: hypothetical protein K2H21_04865 [Muribaculaceae bacterium]|nr:hypothetical protein [Muribaculaceae bacterium]
MIIRKCTRALHIAILMIAALTAALCAGCSDEPTRNEATFRRVRALMDSTPQEALRILDSIPRAALQPGLDSARFVLLHALAEDKTYTHSTPDSLLLHSLEVLQKNGNNADVRMANYLIGSRLDRQKRYPQAIDYLISAENLIDYKTSPYEKGLIYSELSECCHASFNGMLAIEYVQKAYQCYLQADKPEHARYALYEMATFYNNSARYSEAIPLFHRTLHSADSAGNPAMANIARAGMAYAYIGLDSLKEALRWFHMIPDSAGIMDNQSIALRAYAERRAGNLQVADSLSRLLLDMGDYRGIYALNPDKISSREIVDAYAEQDRHNAESYLSSYTDRLPSVISHNFEMRRQLMDAHSKTQKMWIFCLTCAIITTAIFAIIAIRIYRRRLHFRQESMLCLSNDFLTFMRQHNEHVAIMEHTQSKAIHATESLMTNHMSALNRMIESYYASEENSPKARKKMADTLDRLISGLQSDSDVQEEFKNMVNVCHNNIVTRLRDEYPSMPDSDILLFTYIASGMSTLLLSKIYHLETLREFGTMKNRLKMWIKRHPTPSQQDFLKLF